MPGPGRAGCSVGTGPGRSRGWPWENDIRVGRASLPEDRAALLAQGEVKILKGFQLFSFCCGILFFQFCCVGSPECRAASNHFSVS